MALPLLYHKTETCNTHQKNKINPWHLTSEAALLIIPCCTELLDGFYLVNVTVVLY